jgi:hypothetical protein
MAPRKRFLLRIDERLYAALERWAAQDLRSVNGQIEYLLTEAVRRSGRLAPDPAAAEPAAQPLPDRGAGLDESEGEV